jgi:hypothetical protein
MLPHRPGRVSGRVGRRPELADVVVALAAGLGVPALGWTARAALT